MTLNSVTSVVNLGQKECLKLPPMALEEILENTHLHSLASNNYYQIISERPFRSSHHSASETAISRGGKDARPGEISLDH